MLKNQFDTIIFDLGGVILTLDYQLTIDAFSKLAGKSFQDLFTQYAQLPFFDQYERGEITSDVFRNHIREEFKIASSDVEIDDAWNAMLGHIPQERIDFLADLGQEKRIFLLSNTNEIHLKAFNRIVNTGNNIDDFSSLFEKAYFSHLTGMRKPEKRIFEMVVSENNLTTSSTLFIDDSIQHVEGAKKTGLNAALLEKDQSIIELLCS